MSKINHLLYKYEKYIPIVLFLFYFIITVPGTSWGLPYRLHPQELIKVVFKALDGDWEFDSKVFIYTSLSKYVMFWIGKFFLWLDFSHEQIYLGIRLFSVLLGAGVVSITYRLTRYAGGSIYVGLLASFLMISNSQLSQDSRFAHNDIYLTFLVCLTAFSLIRYFTTRKRTWLYLSFFEYGLVISSKQTGLSIILAIIALYLFIDWKFIRKDLLRTFETLFISGVLTILGFGIGTPKAIGWAVFYFKRMIPVFLSQATYNYYPGDVIGLFGQWGTLKDALGGPVFVLGIITFVAVFVKLVLHYVGKVKGDEKFINTLMVLFVFIIAVDLPLLVGYHRRPRFFLPAIPFLVILISFFLRELLKYARNRNIKYAKELIFTGIFITISFSMLRVASMDLMFINDSRMVASEYIKTLPTKSSIEYFYYPPPIDLEVFTNAGPYPIHFIKWEWEEDVLPPGYNIGEEGLEERKPEYLIWDSFTYSRYSDDRVCERHQVECDLYKKLFAGETNYELIASFEYDVPWFIPKVNTVFLNPEIYIFQRVSGD